MHIPLCPDLLRLREVASTRASARALLAFLLLSIAGIASGATPFDGPYVRADSNGGWIARYVENSGGRAAVREQALRTGDTFEVAAVGSMPAFAVRVRANDGLAPVDIDLARNRDLFIVADTHGEYEIFGELLQQQRIVDRSLQWTFGTGHLVVLGDVFDRGAHQVEILWLLYELQSQAARAGGGVHVLTGNHEAMVLGGDLRYLHPKYPQSARALGAQTYAALFDDRSLLGAWLRSRAAVLRIGKLLCMHGGISPQLIQRDWNLERVNTLVRAALAGERSAQIDFVMGPLGPLWYRGYFPEGNAPALASSGDIDAMLRAFAVDRIVVGHTRVPTVTSLYDGRIIAVQVYPHRDAESGRAVMESLLVRGNSLQRASIDGSREPL